MASTAVDLPDDLFHRLHRIGEVQPFDAIGALGEFRGHRRVHADNADLHATAFDDGVGGQIGIAVVPDDVTRQRRALELLERGSQHRQAEVELVVAHHPDIVIERVEAQHHRADGLMLEGFDEVALNGVAGVHGIRLGCSARTFLT